MALSGLLGLVALGVATAGAVVLAGLADSVLSRGRAVSIDARVHQWVVGHRAAWLTGAMKVLTELGAAPVIAAAVVTTAVVTIAAHRRRDTVLVIAATAGAALATAVIKAAMARARPAGVDQLIHVTGAAFPSGHTAQATACYGAIATIVTRWGRRLATSLAVCTGGAFVALGVGVSRVYLGVHWLSDVVAGWALGATWLAALLAAQAGYQLLCERPMVHWPSCWQGEPGSRAPGPSAGEQGGSR